MITFKRFLLEDNPSHTTPADFEEFVEWCETKAPAALNQAQRVPLFRGTDDAERLFNIGDSRNYERHSLNLPNFYTIWTSNHPSWDDFPRRNRSAICSSRERSARSFGKVHWIIPANDAQIGICPANDFWNSFNDTFAKVHAPALTINMLVNKLETLITIWGQFGDIKAIEKDYDKFSSVLMRLTGKVIDDMLALSSQSSMSNLILSQFSTMMDHNKYNNMYDAFEDLLDPIKNGFKHAQGKNYANTIMPPTTFAQHGLEYWIEGEIALVGLNSIRESTDKNILDFFQRHHLNNILAIPEDPPIQRVAKSSDREYDIPF